MGIEINLKNFIAMKIFRIYAAAAGISGIFLPFPYTLAAGEAPSVEKTESGV